MWPEDWARRLVTSPVTQTWPTDFSSNRLTCAVSSETDKTFLVCSVGNSSPKSHCDLDLLTVFATQICIENIFTAFPPLFNFNSDWK